MSLINWLCADQAYPNRRGLRLPLLLGRLHLGLIFCGSTCASSRKSSSDNGALRRFLFIATVLISKCGSSAFPYRERLTSLSTPSVEVITQQAIILHGDDQDLPLDLILSQNIKTISSLERGGDSPENSPRHVKTLGYFLKGLILPMLISLTLSFGFVIYKNRVKRARLQAIQTALEDARNNPNQLGSGIISNALLSVIDTRGEWSLISGGNIMEGDDYVGEGGETARHMPLVHDQPPDYSTVFDPPSYEEATCSHKKQIIRHDSGLQNLFYAEDDDDDGKRLITLHQSN